MKQRNRRIPEDLYGYRAVDELRNYRRACKGIIANSLCATSNIWLPSAGKVLVVTISDCGKAAVIMGYRESLPKTPSCERFGMRILPREVLGEKRRKLVPIPRRVI